MQPFEQLSIQRLLSTVQDLSLARDLNSIMAITRKSARELTGADGATFILRDGDKCFYADENAIGPLWKGNRFPMSACISGWAMEHCEPAIVPDIYQDSRIPIEAYKPTFVKSLVVVPIRRAEPVGAIGNYWARQHEATPHEVQTLQALADSISVAMENVNLYSELEKRVAERTAQLEAANKELEAFSYAVSHDLRAPLRAISGFSKILQEDAAAVLNQDCKGSLDRIIDSAAQMHQLIEDLMTLSRETAREPRKELVDLSDMAQKTFSDLRSSSPDHKVEFVCGNDIFAHADIGLMQIVLTNLLANAWKFTSQSPNARIEFNCYSGAHREKVFFSGTMALGLTWHFRNDYSSPSNDCIVTKNFREQESVWPPFNGL